MALRTELEAHEEKLVSESHTLQEQLASVEEQLASVRKLLEGLGGDEAMQTRLRITGKLNWAQIARDHNITNWTPWTRKGDSAHRAIRRHQPDLHSSVPHYCIYDQRSYP